MESAVKLVKTDNLPALELMHNKNQELLSMFIGLVENLECKMDALVGIQGGNLGLKEKEDSLVTSGVLGSLEIQQHQMGLLLFRLETVSMRFNGVV